MPDKFRILSLSGGGIRGVFGASFLAKLETLTDKTIADHFDLIVGTSTGGLIALALGMGHTAASVRDFYLSEAATIFPPSSSWWRRVRGREIIRAKHDDAGLQDSLQRVIGQGATLGMSKRPLVINTFHAAKGAPLCFKTRHHERYVNDWRRPAWEIGMATAAAPVFFRAFASEDGTDYIDGGVWANCPALVGVIEAMTAFNRPRTEIELLSIGTTRTPFSVAPKARKGGAWQNVSMRNRRVLDLLMEAQRAATVNMTKLLIGEANFVEVDHLAEPDQFAMDDVSDQSLRDLKSLGEHYAQAMEGTIGSRFLSRPAAPFTPAP